MLILQTKYIVGLISILLVASLHKEANSQATETSAGSQQFIPSKLLTFKAVESDPSFSLPSTMVDYPHCLADGTLVVQAIDWAAVNKTPKGKFPKYNYVVSAVRGKVSHTLTSADINDLTDFNVTDFFPSADGFFFLVQGTKDHATSERGAGKSPAGIVWSAYKTYVARFAPDGSYKGATELPTRCDLSSPGKCEIRHLAVFRSGDMLVSESDPETSNLKVLYLKSSGEIVKQIDVPSGRVPMVWGDATSNPDVSQAAQMFLASVFFTAVGDNVLVWRANSKDAVVQVSDGGAAREIPLELPDGWRLADMISANDRWVAHLRTGNTPAGARMSDDTDAYYDVRPQDGSLSAKLVQKGEAPRSIACEDVGVYTSFMMNDAGKMVLLVGTSSQ